LRARIFFNIVGVSELIIKSLNLLAVLLDLGKGGQIVDFSPG